MSIMVWNRRQGYNISLALSRLCLIGISTALFTTLASFAWKLHFTSSLFTATLPSSAVSICHPKLCLNIYVRAAPTFKVVGTKYLTKDVNILGLFGLANKQIHPILAPKELLKQFYSDSFSLIFSPNAKFMETFDLYFVLFRLKSISLYSN